MHQICVCPGTGRGRYAAVPRPLGSSLMPLRRRPAYVQDKEFAICLLS